MVGEIPHERVPAALSRAEIGLLPYSAGAPSYFSPLKLFEYLAAGLAVVAGDLPGVTAVVDARSAILVRPGDPRALAAAVGRLTVDADLRGSLGHAGRRLATRHTWRNRASRILAAVDEPVGAQMPSAIEAGARE